MPSKSGTGGAARPTGETRARRYTAAEWAERERDMQERLGARAGRDDHTLGLRVTCGAGATRVAVSAHLPHPSGDGSAGQTIELSTEDEGVRALLAACERVLEAHRARAEGAATIAWAQMLLAHVAAGEV